ncbi:hypothetical protein NP233_g11483 [Leucocoprinus birnbaumii]|uniref:Uncharacterized protein n=1 Tax=Leucocoprinus birnbaumii TaxID=56174 RepID=A0AAD5VGH6_9AGAR|nr:hypothetical protein NP233_g11483 [Leucocoprinus birnbaumii]
MSIPAHLFVIRIPDTICRRMWSRIWRKTVVQLGDPKQRRSEPPKWFQHSTDTVVTTASCQEYLSSSFYPSVARSRRQRPLPCGRLEAGIFPPKTPPVDLRCTCYYPLHTVVTVSDGQNAKANAHITYESTSSDEIRRERLVLIEPDL